MGETYPSSLTHRNTYQVRHSLPWSDTMFPHCTHTVRHSVYQAFTQALMHSVRHLLTESLIHQSYTPIHPVRHSVIQSLTHSHSVRDTHSWSPPDAYYTGRHSLTHWDIHSPPPPPRIWRHCNGWLGIRGCIIAKRSLCSSVSETIMLT